MTAAAKVAGIGVAKGGLRGGLGFPASTPSNDQFMVRRSGVSMPVSASISQAVHLSAEEDAMHMQRPVWDDWEFPEVEPIPRVVFSKPPSLQEAKQATEDLTEAINM